MQRYTTSSNLVGKMKKADTGEWYRREEVDKGLTEIVGQIEQIQAKAFEGINDTFGPEGITTENLFTMCTLIVAELDRRHTAEQGVQGDEN